MSTIHTAEGLIFRPYITHNLIGYEVTHPDGRTETVELMPSTATDEGPGTGNVFLYQNEDALTHVAFYPVITNEREI